MSEPFYRVDSPRCELWHKLAKNSSILEKDMEEVLCQPCKRMVSHLDQRVRSSTALSPIEKVARLDPSSRCPLAALSPSSRKKRKDNLLKERYQYKKKYEHMDLTLDDEQNEQMANIVDIINRDAGDTLDQVVREVGSQGCAVHEIWKNDTRVEFEKDQALNGKLSIYVTHICSLLHLHSTLLGRIIPAAKPWKASTCLVLFLKQ